MNNPPVKSEDPKLETSPASAPPAPVIANANAIPEADDLTLRRVLGLPPHADAATVANSIAALETEAAALAAAHTQRAAEVANTAAETAQRLAEAVVLRTQLATAQAELVTAQTTIANEREALGKQALAAALQGGRLTPAEVPVWQEKLKTQFANALPELFARPVKFKTQGTAVTLEHGGRKTTISNAQERGELIRTELSKEMATNGGDYDAAWKTVQTRFAAVFDAMAKPAAA